MEGKINFQTLFLVIFGVFLVLGTFVFGGIIPSPGGKEAVSVASGDIKIWGTVPSDIVSKTVTEGIRDTLPNVRIFYERKSPASLDTELIEALASGEGPDIVFLPESLILRYREKIAPLSYEAFPERNFRDSFIQGSELLLFPEGVLALPIFADPMVMYWNRTMFSSAGLSRPPAFWDEFLTLPSSLTKKDPTGRILKSAVAFGEYANVSNAKDILVLLALQSGNRFVVFDEGSLVSSFEGDASKRIPSAEEVFRFYTDFADPKKTVYSWNRSLPISQNAFAAQTLAVYFGFASEISMLRQKNPNFDFDVAVVPQIRDYDTRSTLAHITSAAMMKTSKNQAVAQYLVQYIASAPIAEELAQSAGLPPVRRDLLAKKPADPTESVFYDSGIIGTSWLDPDPRATASLFRNAIEAVLSGTASLSDAIKRTNNELALLLEK